MKTTALITGASGGIGAAIAVALANKDTYTILLGRNTTKLKQTAKLVFKKDVYGAWYQCDVTKQSDIEKIFKVEEEQLKSSKLIVVNNAGYGGPFHRTDEIREEEWDVIFNTNVKAAFLFCKQLLPLMRENNWGRIINIASIYGQVGGALSSAYAASKHALVGYTKSLAAEWGAYNITCNIISPGFINTNMGAASNETNYATIINQIPLKRQGTPEEIAKLVLFLCSEESSYINGADIVIDGGFLAGRSFE